MATVCWRCGGTGVIRYYLARSYDGEDGYWKAYSTAGCAPSSEPITLYDTLEEARAAARKLNADEKAAAKEVAKLARRSAKRLPMFDES